MIKVIAKAFRKNSSFALTAISYNFSAQLQTTSFPYAIGGLKNVPYTQSIGSLVTINELFGNDTLQGFKEAYAFTLNALANKDLKSLQSICQPTLLKGISMKTFNLINTDAKVEAICGPSFKAFGAGFIRGSGTQLKLMKSQDDSDFFVNFGMMNPSSMMKHIASGHPILMGYEILFKSEMKLIPQGQRAENVPQIHSIQFQVQSHMQMKKYMDMAMQMSKGGKPDISNDKAKQILKEMIGNNFEWKIGDIDRTLKRNIKIVG